MTVHLSDAVGELLKAPTLRIHPLPVGRPDVYYTVRAAPLLEQLADAVANSTGTHAHTVPGPRLPLSAEAVDLWYQILVSLHGWAKDLGVDRTGSASQLLQRLRTTAVRAGHEDVARMIQRRCWCGQDGIEPNDCGRCWVHRIQAMLAPDVADREIRGAACTHCRTEQVDSETGTKVMVPTTTTLIERDGEIFRVPAIVVRVAVLPDAGPDDLWVYRMCRACGAEGWLDYSTSTAA